MVFGVVFSDSSVAYNTQYLSNHVPSLMPITNYTIPLPAFPKSSSLFPGVKSLSWFVSLSDFFPSGFPPFPYGPLCYDICSTHDWNQEIIVFLCLTYFIWNNPPPVPSMLMQMVGIHPFWWLSDIPLYIWTTCSSSIHLMKDIAPSTVWLLWTLLLWTLGCVCPFFPLHRYLWG